jgi:hypothetical protein
MVANRAACDVVLVAMGIGAAAMHARGRSAMIANDSCPRLLHRADTDDRLRDGLHRRMVNDWVVARSGAMHRRMMMVMVMVVGMMMLAATAIVVVVMIMGEDGTTAGSGHQRE